MATETAPSSRARSDEASYALRLARSFGVLVVLSVSLAVRESRRRAAA